MNIFYLCHNTDECAKAHVDKHVVKMILEYAQLLSTAHRLLDGKGVRHKLDRDDDVIYAATHGNHPSAVWARAASCNYEWLYSLFCSLCDEYTYRYRKKHLTDVKLRGILKRLPDNIRHSNIWYSPTPAMPDECKIDGDVLESYRNYYRTNKGHLAKWTRRNIPVWYST